MAGTGSGPGGLMGPRMDGLGAGDGGAPGSKALLNTYIHNYFMDEGLVEIAKIIRHNGRLSFQQDKLTDKPRKGANGVDDSIDADAKDDLSSRLDGFGNPGDSFLCTWWGLFWDMWSAARRDKNESTPAATYLAHTQAQRARQQQQQSNQLLQQTGMLQGNFPQYRQMMQPPMELQKRAMVNNGRMNPAALQNMRIQQHMAAQGQMPRDGSEMDTNAPQRGQSPMLGENVPSPKRARIDNGGFNPQQMVPNGRGPGSMGPQPPNGNAPNANMLINSSFDPNSMSPAMFNGQATSAQKLYSQELVNHQRSAMGAAALPKGATPIPQGQGSPTLMPSGPDGQLSDHFLPNTQNNMRAINGGNGGALADYQMQLMLLEQQNKKRLMMARQENDVPVANQMSGQNFATPMSPRGSRTGHSPNSSDPTKRGTPKMNQDSPLPDGSMNRASPAPTNFEPGQMQPNMVQPFGMMGGPNGMMGGPNGMMGGPNGMMGGPNGMMGRPPNMHPNGQMSQQQMEILRGHQNPMRMGNGGWPPGGMPNPGQMLPQGQAPQPPQIDNNQRNNMPPPQGPPAGRTQPPSPQQTAAPPTPSQGSKPNPKAKKDAKDNKKKANKKASTTTGATPNAETEQSDDVPPPTPSTPKNAASNLIKGPAPQPTMSMNMQGQPPNSMPSGQGGMGIPQDNNSMIGPFGSLDATNDMSNFTDFDDLLGGQDNTDVLHGFDFDAFLHQDPVPGFDFDSSYLNGDGLETGMGD